MKNQAYNGLLDVGCFNLSKSSLNIRVVQGELH